MGSKSDAIWRGVGLLPALLLMACTPEQMDAFAEVCVGGTVNVRTQDSSAPSVWMRFPDPATGKAVTLKSGDADMAISVDVQRIVPIWAFAEDPEGVQAIFIAPSRDTVLCEADTPSVPKLTMSLEATFPAPEMSPFKMISQAVKPGDSATTRLCTLFIANHADPCDKGWHTTGHEIYVFAQAKNFGGLVTRTPQLTIKVTP